MIVTSVYSLIYSFLAQVGGWWVQRVSLCEFGPGPNRDPPQKVEEDGWIEGCRAGWMDGGRPLNH